MFLFSLSGYPPTAAANIALAVVRTFLEKNSDKVLVCKFRAFYYFVYIQGAAKVTLRYQKKKKFS